MSFNFKSSYLANSVSVTILATGLTLSVIAQKTQAQVPPNSATSCLGQPGSGAAPTPAFPLCINGAGATFPVPVYQGVPNDLIAPPRGSWFNTFGEASGFGYPGGAAPSDATNPPGPVNNTLRVNYSGRGSTAGINTIIAAALAGTGPGSPVPTTIAFGGTDALPSDAQLASYNGGPAAGLPFGGAGFRGFGPLVQVPSVTGAITLSFNLPASSVDSTTGIVLTRTQYCGIFQGTITNWTDATLAGSGYIGGSLPISVVVRADGSGTTQNFTNHLNAVCGGFPVGQTFPATPGFLSGTGNQGVATTVATTSGAIGYVENATRISFPVPSGSFFNTTGPDTSLPIRTLPDAQIVNRNGIPVFPDNVIPATGGSTTTAAFNNVTTTSVPCAPSSNPALPAFTPRGNNVCRLIIDQASYADPTDANAYPIVAATYLLFYGNYSPSAPNARAYFGNRGSQIATGIQQLINYIYSADGDNTARSRGYAPLPNSIKAAARPVVVFQVRPN